MAPLIIFQGSYVFKFVEHWQSFPVEVVYCHSVGSWYISGVQRVETDQDQTAVHTLSGNSNRSPCLLP